MQWSITSQWHSSFLKENNWIFHYKSSSTTLSSLHFWEKKIFPGCGFWLHFVRFFPKLIPYPAHNRHGPVGASDLNSFGKMAKLPIMVQKSQIEPFLKKLFKVRKNGVRVKNYSF
jgi:hypothetical protein